MKAAAESQVSIAIYDEIGMWGVTAADFKAALDEFDVDRINLNIHSPGGSVFDGLAIFNMLKNHRATVHVHVDGLAASIASVIAMAGDVVTIPENAFFMVHKPWVSLAGDADELRENADLLDKVETTLIGAYAGKTGLSRDDISELVAAETWLTGQESVDYGFADELAEPIAAAAHFTHSINQRFEQMPSEMNELIDGKTVEAKAVEAPTVEAKAEAAPVAAAPQPTVADFQAAETARRAAIAEVFNGFEDHSELKASLLNDFNATAASASKQLLASIGAAKTPSAAAIYVDNGAIIRDSISNSIAARAGLEAAESGNKFSSMSLMEIARASLTERGVGVAGAGKLDIVAQAFTHSSADFSSVLMDVAHKSMLKGYTEADETFQQWTQTGSLSDFRVSNRVDMSNFPNLARVEEGAEYSYGTTSDRAEQIVLATYGKKFSITRQAIVNDDLSAFTRIPQLMGRAAIRTIGDMVYAVLTGNPLMSDGTPLFAAAHNNDHEGAFGVSSIDAVKTAMALQKEGHAHSLNIRPKYLLTPVGREAQAKAFLGAEFDPAYPDSNVPNPVRGLVEVIADARLDDSSTTTSYFVADSGQYDTVEVAYLDGNSTPFLDSQNGFDVDGAVMKVRIDAGVAPLSFRTLARLADGQEIGQ